MNTQAAAAAGVVHAAPPVAPSRASAPWWIAAAGAAIPLIAAGIPHDRFASSILAAAALQGLFAVSWVLLAASGQPSLGHALPYGVGAYAAAFVVRGISLDASSASAVTPAVLTGAAAFAGACAAGVQGRLTRRLSPVFIAAATLATVEASRSLAAMWTAPVLRGVNEGDLSIPLGPFAAGERVAMWLAAAAMAAGILGIAAVLRSRPGVALRAAAAGDREAAALGFDAPRLRLAAFAVSGAIAGAAGGLAAQFAGRVTPELFSWRGSLFVAAAALAGGPASAAGVAAAGYLVAAAAQLAEVPAGAQMLAFAAVIAAASICDPRNVLGLSFMWHRRPAAGEGTRTGARRTPTPRVRMAGR